jgi:hypothetical protein
MIWYMTIVKIRITNLLYVCSSFVCVMKSKKGRKKMKKKEKKKEQWST